MKSSIHIALATDDNYVDFALNVINSILHFAPPIEQRKYGYVFHILTNGLSPEQLARYDFYRCDDVEIIEHQVDQEAFSKRWSGRQSPMYYRLELAERLSDIDRVIYLDCDMVVLDDITELWESDLKGYPLGGCGDRAGLQESRKCYNKKGVMFNSGMMVLDLAKWRREDLTNKLATFYEANFSWVKFADQGLLNAYFDGNYQMLPQRWNFINSVYRNPVVPGMYSDEDVIEAIKRPGIVHFTGHHKPWLFWKSFHHPYGYTFCLSAIHAPLPFFKRLKYWLKLKLSRRFVDSKHNRPWNKSMLRDFTWEKPGE